MKHRDCNVIVVGGGHAGVEAALAAARCGASTILITHSRDKLGEMSCNPAIGGLGKGHIVREIDALDGAMGTAADLAGIQYRLLNRSKGAAVQGPRVQTDRKLYRRAIQTIVSFQRNLTVLEGEVVDLLIDGVGVKGCVLRDGSEVTSTSVILTTGTFLRGMIHCGEVSFPAGRHGDPASEHLSARMEDLGFRFGRLKTGTPPRLDGRTIDWKRVGRQEADAEPVFMSFLTTETVCRQLACGIAETNARTHEIIADNLTRSALYGGKISGAGPRYCPSIEDKVVRFREKETHQVFLEPEGLDDSTVYPNGISTSLPEDVQHDLVRSISGLEACLILRPGYAIEYDYVDPRGLDATLQTKSWRGLFLAGQICGTTGYEEAAGQGLIAGINAAAQALDREALVLHRHESYIGVMIDDLITRGVTEPYRMFTSRAEFRLQLRADNADQRLTPRGYKAGCVGEARHRAFDKKLKAIGALRAALEELAVSPDEAEGFGLSVRKDGVRRTLYDILGHSDSDPSLVFAAAGLEDEASERLLDVTTEARYAPYLARQAADAERLRRDEAISIPDGLDYMTLGGLSSELRTKLDAVRPRTLAQAGRMEGMTPVALNQILLRVRAGRK